MNIGKNGWLFIVLLTLSASTQMTFAQSGSDIIQVPQPIVLTNEQGEYPLGLHLEILEDPAGELSIEQVSSLEYDDQFVPSQKDVPNYGFTDTIYWVRFRVKNEASSTRQWYLVLGYPNVHYLDFYHPLPARAGFKHIRTGTLLPFDTRDIKDRLFIFTLSLPTDTERTMYLRFDSRAAMVLSLTILSGDRLRHNGFADQLWQGCFYGVLFIMAGYNLFLFLALRDRSYLYYVLTLFSVIMYEFSFGGLAQQYLWPNLERMNRFVVPISLISGLIAALKFASTFLQTRVQVPRGHQIITVLSILLEFLLVASPFANYTVVLTAVDFLFIPGLLSIVSVGFITWRRGYRPACYYLLAGIAVLTTMLIHIMVCFTLLPSNLLTEHSYQVGIILLVLLLSLALADRINIIKEERVNAQEETLRLRNELNETLRKANRELEQQVAERTQQLNKQMRFESLIAELSARFINLPASNVDEEIMHGLRQIVEFLGVDWGTILEFTENGIHLSATHSYAVEDIQPFPHMIMNDQYPWHTETLRWGEVIVVSRIPDDLPDKIRKLAREYACRVSIKSYMAIPLPVGGTIRYVIGFASFRSERTWPEELIQRLRIVGETFANALLRKQAGLALQKAHDELKDRVDELTTLNQIIRTMTSDLHTALKVVIRQIGQLLNAYGAIIALLDITRQELTIVAQYSPDEHEPSLMNVVLPHSPGIARVIDAGQSLIIPQAQTSPLFESLHELMRVRHIQSVMIVPLQVRGKLIGTINLSITQADREFSPTEVKLVETIAGQIAGAIENARLFEEEHHQRQVAESLREVALVLNSSLDRKAVLAKILEQLGRVLQYDSAGVFLQEDHDLVLSDGVNLAETFIGNRIPLSHKNPTARVFKNRQSLVIANVQTDPYWKMWQGGERIRSWIGVPLLIGKKGIGVLTVDNFEIGVYCEEDARILQIFANQAAIAIENARLFDEAQHTREEAETANKAKSEFLTNISHELRTPLNAILGYAQILKHDPQLLKSYKSKLEIIERSGTHLLNLINDILDLSKIEAKKLELDESVLEFPRFLTEIAEMVQIRVQQKGLTFHYETTSELPQYIYTDEQLLRQILLNLLSNAVKFTDRGSVILRIANCELRIEPTPYPSQEGKSEIRNLKFEIEDTGIGIPEAKWGEIFSPFKQVCQHTRKVEGTGLGLAISRELLHLMGSELHVQSTVNKGSTFWFDLVCTQVSDRVMIQTFDERMPSGFKGQKRVILVVDNHEDSRAVLVDLLLSLGFEVIEATGGQDGVNKALKHQPDLILMDLFMPDVDGFEAMRRIRQVPKLQQSKIVAISASATPSIQQKSFDAGFDNFIAKPVQAQKLLNTLATQMEVEWNDETRPEPGQQEQIDVLIEEDEKRQAIVVVPVLSEINVLYEFALDGDILGLRQQLDMIEHLDERYLPFVREIRDLVNQFQVDQICARLKQYMKGV